jgi:hypothetical protein
MTFVPCSASAATVAARLVAASSSGESGGDFEW